MVHCAVSLSDGRGVDCAHVFVSSKCFPQTILGSTFSADDGSFNLKIDNDCDSLILQVSSMEIAPTRMIVPNRTDSYKIIVESRVLELKEVVVKAKKIYSQGDTINYNVVSFLSRSDQSVADVLRKMPGINVSDAGQVSYQGKPIKNFILRGLTL